MAEAASLVEAATEALTCSTNTADDLAERLSEQCQQMAMDVVFTRLAHEIWSEQTSDEARSLAGLLKELLAEQERHQDALARLGELLDEQARRETHEHLEPMESYFDLVLERLFKPLEQASEDTPF